MVSWKDISDQKKLELVYRRYVKKEDVAVLASEVEMNAVTLNRQLQRMRAALDDESPDWRNNLPEWFENDEPVPSAPVIEFPKQKPLPEYEEMFQLLKKGPISLDGLCSRFDRSPETMLKFLDNMRQVGYVVEKEKQYVHVNTHIPPKLEFKPAKTLADLEGQEIVFGVASDAHFGSTHAQVSARARFIEIAYHEYGVRHIFDPGDITTGVNGYRGQEWDLIPSIRPNSRRSVAKTTEAQIWLANQCTPRLPGLKYYELGGNHDYWHIVNSGIDAVARLAQGRDDMYYLGYDVADVPLTDRASIRLWHPSGGVPYSISYRLQKGLEQLAFDELSRAVELNENPKVRLLLAGHLHIEVKFHRGPMIAAHVGCFEGQTNYLKRKGLYPTIGGAIFKVRLTDGGLIQRVEYTFIPFAEVENDWMNWPTPPVEDEYEPDEVTTIFRAG